MFLLASAGMRFLRGPLQFWRALLHFLRVRTGRSVIGWIYQIRMERQIMNELLLQWGLVSFMIGIFLSLPLAAVHYDQSASWTKIFTNPRKLKSAHLDFFMQAFAAGFVYVLELSSGSDYPMYIIIPLLYGTIGNPLILLLESTAIFKYGAMAIGYRFLKATSPACLLFAWLLIAGLSLPYYAAGFLILFVVAGSLLVWCYNKKSKLEGR